MAAEVMRQTWWFRVYDVTGDFILGEGSRISRCFSCVVSYLELYFCRA
jgi:hypothetical protein